MRKQKGVVMQASVKIQSDVVTDVLAQQSADRIVNRQLLIANGLSVVPTGIEPVSKV
jgi:hypothetical protein